MAADDNGDVKVKTEIIGYGCTVSSALSFKVANWVKGDLYERARCGDKV